MSTKDRLNLFKKIADASKVAQTATPPATTSTTAPTPTIAGSPTSASALALYPQLVAGWGANNSSFIEEITNTLNNALYVLSLEDIDFNTLRSNGFNINDSKYSEPTLKIVISLTKAVFNNLLTNGGQAFIKELSPTERSQKLALLKQSASQIKDGPINTQLPNKIGGNLKTILLNHLNQIK